MARATQQIVGRAAQVFTRLPMDLDPSSRISRNDDQYRQYEEKIALNHQHPAIKIRVAFIHKTTSICNEGLVLFVWSCRRFAGIHGLVVEMGVVVNATELC